tara:strand:+ start:2761 stop:3402 length:642 start_codon:yes stop_codon:yes gene_type:complete
MTSETTTPAPKLKPKEKPHYVNNAEFSQAVVDYVTLATSAKESGDTKPMIPDYIARCFLKICEGLSHKANFVRYTYREEMVMDAVENCLKAIENYNLEVATRTGKPNAFAYFTQISWYAFLRRIEKEKKQQDVKMRYLAESGLEELVQQDEGNSTEAFNQTHAFVNELRLRIDSVKNIDKSVQIFSKGSRPRVKRKRRVDSDLSDFLPNDNEE